MEKKNIFIRLKKSINLSELIFSIILSLAIFFMKKIHFEEYVYNNNYIDKIFLKEFRIILLYIPIVYLLTHGIVENYKIFFDGIIVENRINVKRFLIFTFLFLMIIYLLYYLSFYPGGVYIDTFTSLRMIANEKINDGYYQEFSNQQPLLYTLSMYIVKSFIPNYYLGFGVYCFIQILLMVGMFTYFVFWLLKKGVSSKVVSLMVVFLGTFRLYPIYSVSIWKDTVFSMSLFMYVLVYIDVVLGVINRDIEKKNVVKFSFFTITTVFLRNNAIYIVIACFLLLILLDIKRVIYNLKNKKENVENKYYRSLIISQVLIIIFCVVFPKLLFINSQIKKEKFAESIAIPIQQVARVVCVEGNINDSQKELIEKVLKFDRIKKDYKALIVDPIKWDKEFNNEYLETHKAEFLKLWVELFFQNPGEYIQAYLLQTSGFWTFNVGSIKEGYHSAINFETLNNILQIQNVINDHTEFNLQDSMLALNSYSGGLFFWIMAISMLISFKVSDKKYLLCYMPSFLLWCTIMIATPMGQSLRYVYILVLMIPLDFVLPAILKNRKIKQLKEKN